MSVDACMFDSCRDFVMNNSLLILTDYINAQLQHILLPKLVRV